MPDVGNDVQTQHVKTCILQNILLNQFLQTTSKRHFNFWVTKVPKQGQNFDDVKRLPVNNPRLEKIN